MCAYFSYLGSVLISRSTIVPLNTININSSISVFRNVPLTYAVATTLCSSVSMTQVITIHLFDTVGDTASSGCKNSCYACLFTTILPFMFPFIFSEINVIAFNAKFLCSGVNILKYLGWKIFQYVPVV